MKANTSRGRGSYHQGSDRRKVPRLRHSAVLLLLGVFIAAIPRVTSGRVSADTATRLEGNVLFYNVFVTDHRGFTWTTYDTSLVMERMRQASVWLTDQAALVGVPLNVTVQGLNILTSYSAAVGLKQVWICDVLRFLGTNVNPDGDGSTNADGDGACSDDVALWLQKTRGHDHVVIGFHVKGDPDAFLAKTVAAPDIDNEVLGSIVLYYDEQFLFDWKGYAHEFLHEFGACDEYIGEDDLNPACWCACDNAYERFAYASILPGGQTNPNCPPCVEGSLPCIMKGGAPDAVMCEFTRRQIGWGDSDMDGSADAIVSDGDLLTVRLTSLTDWRRANAENQFFVTDAAGGELQSATIVDDIGNYSVAGSFSQPHNAQTQLLATCGNILAVTGGADSVYAATYDGSVLGPWRGVGAAPSGTNFGAAVTGGFLYIAGGWSDAYLKCAPISPSGSLGEWVTITGLPAYTQDIAAANGFLYAAWVDQWGAPFQDRWLRVSGARIRPDGTLDSWDSADPVYTSGGSGDGVNIWGMASDGGGLFIVADGEYRDRAISTTINPEDGTRTLPWHNVEIGPTVGRSLSSGSVFSAAGRVFIAGGFQNIEATYSPIPDVYMGTINTDKSVTSWVRRGDLPFSAGHTGVCVTSDETSMHLWVGGGQVLSGDPPTTLHVAPFVFGNAYPAEARATYRLALGTAKSIQSIAWRSTDDARVSLRYRADSGGYFTNWTDPEPASAGRIVANTPLLTSCLELELIANSQKLTRIHDVTVVFVDPSPGDTPSGNSVFTTLPNTGGQCRFASVNQAGFTDAVPIENPPAPPSGSASRGAFAITTSASFTGEIEIGLRYDPLAVISEADLKLLHHNNGQWEDITTHVDPIARLVWGRVSSFSTFVIAEDTTAVITGVHDGPRTTPSFTVLQNAPNPFGATTTIRFTLSNSERVSVRVYDVRGRLVRDLFEGRALAGERRLEWDGRNQGGDAVGSGVYFFRFQAGTHVESKKAVLVR